MELTIIVIASVTAIVAVAAVSQRIAVAVPLSLVVAGIALSFLPGLPAINVNPKVVLAGALPPLLYATAVRMPAHDFRRDFKAIGGLAVMLVLLTTICSGLLFDALLPGLGLASALALGAIISPTDAVAATSVGRRLGLPSRLLTILEGEGLVNDASSLVLLSSAVAATTVTVHLWKVGVDFVYAVVIAVAVGLVVGYANVRIRSWLKDPVLSTAVSFVVPFLAWVPAEELGASGVLAAVVTGLVTGHQSPGLLAARDRLAESVNWDTVAFLLESGIFLLMGLQLKTLLKQDTQAGLDPLQALWIGLAAAAVAVLLRMIFVAPLVAALRRDAVRGASAKPQLEQMQTRITDVVAGFTLLAQGLTLPRVIGILKISGDDAAADRAEYGELISQLSGTVASVIDDPELRQPDPREPDPREPDPREQSRYLMLAVLGAERAELLRARSAGTYTSRTLSRAQRALDLAEATLQQIPDLAGGE